MRSFSNDRGSGRSTADGGRADVSFWPTGRTAWLRLVIVVGLGLAALLGPSAIEHTGALYTDQSTVSGDIWATPTITTTPSPSPA